MRGALAITMLVACGEPHALDPPLYTCTDPSRGPEMRQFVDVLTHDSGLDFSYGATDFKAGGLAVADLDGDGRPDIVATSRRGGVAAYRNLGGTRFVPFDDSGLDPTLPINAVAVADLDNDGDPDLVLAGTGFAYVGVNSGDGRFTTTRIEDSGTTEHVLPVDLDGDGRLDLYFSNYDMRTTETLNRLYMNHGDGSMLTFTVSTIGIGRTWTTTAFDFDHDGDQDLYVANDTLAADFGRPVPPTTDPTMLPSDLFLRNDGVGADGVPKLVDIAGDLGLTTPRSSMGGVLGDLDDDGALDVFVPNLGASKIFARGDGQAQYVDRAPELGVAGILRENERCPSDSTSESCLLLSWSAVLADFDLDGHDELLVINGETAPGDLPPAVLYTRGSENEFHEVSPGIGCLNARGIVAADLDGDGDQDLAISQNDGPLAIFENIGHPPSTAWLRVGLHGTRSNRGGVGAVVTLYQASGRRQIRVVGEGGVINTASPTDVVFGLGDDPPDRLDILWPSGRHSEIHPDSGAVIVDEP